MALLLVHAVNPYGFSHLRRVNEDGIDLNRNFLDYSRPLPVNAAYAELHSLVLPSQWPPTADNETAIRDRIARHGERRFQNAVTTGQSTHSDGLYYAGRGPAWSNLMLRAVLREQAAGCTHVGWIDIHTGLGPIGHGEKIYAGHDDAAELARARACWGADVFRPSQETLSRRLCAAALRSAGTTNAPTRRRLPWAWNLARWITGPS